MVSNRLYVVIHGHFYQPPREDPWTLEIERQPSAGLFHDWNERIHQECYAANAASRVLDNLGRIETLVNNYESISFNFGPTLLSWIKRKDPVTYRRIKEADRRSMEKNNGHGNAIAQVYNHIIMPLACDRDIITQIEWGLRSFREDFGRDSEGIWLAETAINDHVARYLIDAGIKFVILSPTQAAQVLRQGESEWADVSHNNIDPSRPYILKEPNGSLAVFFYYGGISAKLSFEHLLRSVETFRGEILSLNNTDKEAHLVHMATDGETYGHHEPFGDMCLSRLLWENSERRDFIFTNYGRMLEIMPPADEVRLKPGNDGLGTAWSCAHGVDRWRRDCGCSTGGQPGWNQKWREPLRTALDFLRDRLHTAVEKGLALLVTDVWKARNDYIDVFYAPEWNTRRERVEVFFKTHCRPGLSIIDRTYVLRMFEALVNAMLMYTSCGWFFTEVSGIETVQDLRYAGRALDLAFDVLPADTRDRFLDLLAHARSNIPEYQHARYLFERFVEEPVYSPSHAAGEFLLTSLVADMDIPLQRPHDHYFYRFTVLSRSDFQKEDWKITKVELKIEDNLIMDAGDYVAYIFQNGSSLKTYIKKFIDASLMNYLDRLIEKDNPRMLIKDFSDWFNRSFTLSHIKYDAKEKVLNRIFEKKMAVLHKKLSIDDLRIDEYLEALTLYNDLGVSIPEKDQVAIRELLNSIILDELLSVAGGDFYSHDFSGLIQIVQTARRARLELDYADILPILRNYVLLHMHTAIALNDLSELQNLESLIDFTNLAGIDFEKYEVQNLLFETLERTASAADFSQLSPEIIQVLLRVATKFNLSVSAFEKRIREKITPGLEQN